MFGTSAEETSRVDQLRRHDRSHSDNGRGSFKGAEDDFFCLRFGVWYPSVDCAYRTLYRTCPGCFDCEQGRFNLKRHRASLRSPRSALACVSNVRTAARTSCD